VPLAWDASFDLISALESASAALILSYESDVSPRRLDALGGFLLEHMQDIDGIRELDGIDASVGIAVVILHDLQHASSSIAMTLSLAGLAGSFFRVWSRSACGGRERTGRIGRRPWLGVLELATDER
jgi:hypothetical protein